MKKILMLALIVLGSISAFGQTSIKWSVNAGIGMSNVYGKNTDDASDKLAYKVGLGVELPFDANWSLHTGLNFVEKGCETDAISNSKLKVNEQYLELPIMAGYRVQASDNLNVLFKVGPYLAYGIGGETKFMGLEIDTFGDDFLQKFDYGVGLGVGFEFGKVFVGLDGNLGLRNLLKSSSSYDFGSGHNLKFYSDVKAKNTSAFLTVGYKF